MFAWWWWVTIVILMIGSFYSWRFFFSIRLHFSDLHRAHRIFQLLSVGVFLKNKNKKHNKEVDRNIFVGVYVYNTYAALWCRQNSAKAKTAINFIRKKLGIMLQYKKQGASAHSITAACWLVDGNQPKHCGRLVACNSCVPSPVLNLTTTAVGKVSIRLYKTLV